MDNLIVLAMCLNKNVKYVLVCNYTDDRLHDSHNSEGVLKYYVSKSLNGVLEHNKGSTFLYEIA